MGWKRKVAAAVMAVGFGLAAGAVQAQTPSIQQCKKNCTPSYQACVKKGTEDATCRKQWLACKNKCDPAAAKTTPAPAPAPAAKKS